MILTSIKLKDVEELETIFAVPEVRGGELCWDMPEWLEELRKACVNEH